MNLSGRIINLLMLAAAAVLFATASVIILIRGNSPGALPSDPEHQDTPAAITVVNTESFGFKGVKIVLETENHEGIEAPVEVAEDTTASGGKCIQILNGAGKDKGQVTLALGIPRDGTYRLWGRRWWMDSCGNSMTFRIEGDPAAVFLSEVAALPRPASQDHIFGDDASYNPVLQEPWLWTRGYLYRLPRGDYTFIIKNREDGVKLDQILLVEDIQSAFGYEYTPTGIEHSRLPTAP